MVVAVAAVAGAAACGASPPEPVMPTTPATTGASGSVQPATVRPEVEAHAPEGWVDISTVDATIVVELRYQGSHNFVGRPIDGYLEPVCLLPERTARALQRVQAAALAQAAELLRCRLPVLGTGLMLQPSRGLCYADLGHRLDRAFDARCPPRESVRMNRRAPGHVLINTAESSEKKSHERERNRPGWMLTLVRQLVELEKRRRDYCSDPCEPAHRG